MSLPPPLTPRSSPGSIPTEHTTQTIPVKEFFHIAAFISSAPWEMLYDIMSAPSEPDLRTLLTNVNFSGPQTQPMQPLIDTCERVVDWLNFYGRNASASRDINSIALALLLRFRVCNAGQSALIRYGDEVILAVAIKIAYGNTCDQWMTGKTWKKILGIDAEVMKKAEIVLLETIEWRTWVREQDYCEFVGRFAVVYEMMCWEDEL